MDNNAFFDIPIVLFTFVRLDTVELIINEIKKIKPAKLYIFSDAPREGHGNETEKVEAVRAFLLSAVDWDCDARLEFRKTNLGCDPNIVSGINEVFKEEEYAIIFEDDAVPRTEFFPFCSCLLKKYKGNHKIQYITGFTRTGSFEFTQYSYDYAQDAPMSGAIATWADRWNQCDFDMKEWPKLRGSKSFKSIFSYNEYFRQIRNATDCCYRNECEAWDYRFHYDQYLKERYAIIPKFNLVTSYGYLEGAFHPQSEIVAEKLKPLMTSSKESFGFPMKDPEYVSPNKRYQRESQSLGLLVNGNYFRRHWNYFLVGVKGMAYAIIPRKVWDYGKRLIKK